MSGYGLPATVTNPDSAAIRRRCTRFIGGHHRRPPQQILGELAALTDPEMENDRYGQEGPLPAFEAEVAALLGKEAAVFMPSGTMCQQIALRTLTDRRGNRNVAMHPRNHLDRPEHFGYQHLHGLRGILVGDADRIVTLDDLRRVAEPLAALLIELPQREIGGQLPTWEELVAITDWARDRGLGLHMDGARLWESGPYYARPYAEIAALFDTVYVSFYKGLGGIAGAALAGPADLIAEARIWQRRHGGNLMQLYPYVISARHGLQTRLDRMPQYHAKAVELAAALAPLPGLDILPNPPQTHMMHLFLRGDRDRLRAAALDLAAETGIWSFDSLAVTTLPGVQKLELSVGDATLDLTTDEIAAHFAAILARG